MRKLLRFATVVSVVGMSAIGMVGPSTPAMAEGDRPMVQLSSKDCADTLLTDNMERDSEAEISTGEVQQFLKLTAEPNVGSIAGDYFAVDTKGRIVALYKSNGSFMLATADWSAVKVRVPANNETVRVFFGDIEKPKKATLVGQAYHRAS